MSEDTRELAERAADGDPDAVEKLVRRYLPDLRAYVRMNADPALRARESCSDLVQSVVRDCLTNLERFQHPSEDGFKYWLFTTAQRKIAHRGDYYRAQKRDREEVELDADPIVDRYRRLSTPSAKLLLKEEIERLERAFDQLSDEHREIIGLAHMMDLPRTEIATRLGKNEGAVRSLLHRAMARLSSILEESDETR